MPKHKWMFTIEQFNNDMKRPIDRVYNDFEWKTVCNNRVVEFDGGSTSSRFTQDDVLKNDYIANKDWCIPVCDRCEKPFDLQRIKWANSHLQFKYKEQILCRECWLKQLLVNIPLKGKPDRPCVMTFNAEGEKPRKLNQHTGTLYLSADKLYVGNGDSVQFPVDAFQIGDHNMAGKKQRTDVWFTLLVEGTTYYFHGLHIGFNNTVVRVQRITRKAYKQKVPNMRGDTQP